MRGILNQFPNGKSSAPVQKRLSVESKSPLGDLAVEIFLAKDWQRRWRLLRSAMPDFANPLTPQAIFRLAARDDVESRLVAREGRRFHLEHGPFTARRIRGLPPRRWTLLVQGINLHVPAADALLRRFDFIPYARLDDVMVSYAAPGGGVGPHVDSYDVFLLQGMGRRRWRLGKPSAPELRAHPSLRLLKRFTAQATHVLRTGDMLYLPPSIAHDGVALDECITYSIGFRAPAAEEIAREFLIFMEERLRAGGRFRDPGRVPARQPAALPEDLTRWAGRVIKSIRWSRSDIAAFIGTFLSEPKATTVFSPPAQPLSPAELRRSVSRGGASLDRRSILLYRRGRFYLNGEELGPFGRVDAALLRTLADRRHIPATAISRQLSDIFYREYRDGALHPGYAAAAYPFAG